MEIDDFFERHMKASTQHRCFYHFTDRRNLSLIRAHGGLLPMRTLRQRKIDVPAPGGNDHSMDADCIFGVDQFVHLCFTKGHPMAHLAQKDQRISDLVWLPVHPYVLKFSGVKITLEVSNKSGAIVRDVNDALVEIDTEVIYTRTNWRDPDIKKRLDLVDKYEVLVPGIIPLNYIKMPDG